MIERIPDISFPVLDTENAFWDLDNHILFYTNSDKYVNIHLDELACDILALCNGDNSISSIATAIAGLYNIERRMAYNDINEFLVAMKQNRIIYLLN